MQGHLLKICPESWSSVTGRDIGEAVVCTDESARTHGGTRQLEVRRITIHFSSLRSALDALSQ